MDDETQVYFHGVLRAGEAGHYLYSPTGYMRGAARIPWPAHDLDGGLVWNAGRWRVEGRNCWRERETAGPSVQGHAALRYRDGWTALAWHDFTGDRRGGSNSLVLARGIFSLDEMLELFKKYFPAQHERQPPLVLRHEDPRPEGA